MKKKIYLFLLAVLAFALCCGFVMFIIERVDQLLSPNINNVLWVDGVTYPTLAACYAALPSTGGTCMVPPNYTETLAASITCSKKYSGFLFTGPATINAGANQFIVSAGNHGCFLDSLVPFGSAVIVAGTGVEWNYTGTGTAIVAGGAGSDTIGLRVKDITIFINNAGSAAVGLDVVRTLDCEIKNVHIIGPGGAITQQGMIMDGTGNFTGCSIYDPIISGVLKGIQLTGSGVNAGNANKIIGGSISSPATGTSFGIDFEASSGGNIVLGTDIENFTTCVNYGATSADNKVTARCEANTNDCAFAAGTQRNKFEAMAGPVGPCTNSGTANSIIDAGTFGIAKDGTLVTSSTTRVANFTAQRHPLAENCQGANPCAAVVQTGTFLVFAPGAGAIQTMVAGSLTITGLPFTAGNTFTCTANNGTTTANAIKVVNNSGSSVTFSSAGATDQFTFVCFGN